MVERARYEPVYGHRDGWPIGPVQMLNKKKKEKTLLRARLWTPGWMHKKRND